MADTSTSNIKVCLFGDSFIKLFTLIENKQMKVHGFKGATARGLRLGGVTNDRGGDGNNNATAPVAAVSMPVIAKEMQTMLNSFKPQDDVFFNFGQVDVHFSYYYKKYKKQESIDLDQIAMDYVECVAALELVEGSVARKTIIGVYPSAPDNDYLKKTLVDGYGILSEKEAALISDQDISLVSRQARVLKFNRVLRETCEKHGILYVDAFDEMTDKAATAPRLCDRYRDVSDCNIHFLWETTLIMWMQRWPWLANLAPKNFEATLQQKFQKYLKSKPWAKSTHDHRLDIKYTNSNDAAVVEQEQKKPGRFSRENLL